MATATRVVLLVGLVHAALAAVPLLEGFERVEVTERSDTGYRLPKDIRPSKYEIRLKPYLDTGNATAFTFDGTVKITFRPVANVTNRIVLHAKDLVIATPPTILPNDVSVQSTSANGTYDFYIVNLNKTLLSTVDYTLNFTFRGDIRNDMTGFYRSYYEEGGRRKWLASTQFQPVHARKVFPCFDEPEFKAVFELTIECPTGLRCVSNSRATVTNATNVHVFEPTPIMSTYLLAFMVSDFVAAENDNVTSILARPGARNHGRYAFDASVAITKELSEYTNVNYFTQHSTANRSMKMDHAAIPDFGAGAMENWGLITYREAYLMVDDTESSTASKQTVARIVSHEIAHMWFGNYITCHWWESTWLNEGFASFFEYFTTHVVLPSFRMNDQFIINQLQVALTADASANSNPLTNTNVNSPAEISGHFGTVSYQKGASVIRMIQHWLGEETFKRGLNNHLTSRKHQTVTPAHLFDALQKAANDTQAINQYQTTVADVFRSWTENAGYPVLHVWVNHTTHTVFARQERFVKKDETSSSIIYRIPITYASKASPLFNNTKPKLIMSNESISLGMLDHDWIILNVQQTGYYRVLYSSELYGYINTLLASNARENVHEYNRAQIVDDAFAFAFENMLNYSNVMDVIQFLDNETSYTPWGAAYANINRLRIPFSNFNKLSVHFDSHILNLMNKTINTLGFATNGSELTKVFRTNTMTLACELKHELCVNTSIKLFNDWVQTGSSIPADHRQFVYCTGLRNGNGTHFDRLWSKYVSESVFNEKVIILNALGCTMDQTRVKQYLMETIAVNSTIRDHDKMLAFNAALRGNKANVPTTWDFVTQNVAGIRRAYGDNSIAGILNAVAARMGDAHLDWFNSFVNGANTLTPAEKTTGINAFAAAKKTMSWVSTKEDDFMVWIDKKYNSASGIGASAFMLIAAVTLAMFNNKC